MKLHKHPLGYKFSPGWLVYWTAKLIEWRKGHEAMEMWLWEGTPYPAGPPMLYQVLEGLTWAIGWGSFSTIDDEYHDHPEVS